MKIFFTLALFFVMFQTNAQTRKDAIVSTIMGIPVFIMSEPELPYEVVATVTDEDAVAVLNAISGTPTYRTIKQSCEIIIANANRKMKKGKFTYDAIIISDDGHSGTCIHYTTLNVIDVK